MIVKGKFSAPSKDFVLGGPLVVALALFSQIKLLEVQGGACYNPAVGLTIIMFDVFNNTGDLVEVEKHYIGIFIFVPILAGLVAGYAQIHH